MTHSKATELIMKRHSNSKLLGLLTKWDEKKTILENMENLEITQAYANNLSSLYQLGFKRSSFGPVRRVYKRTKSNAYIAKWNPKLTLEENGKKLGVNYARASQIANSYGLSWTKHYKGGYEAVVTAKSFQANIRMQMKSMRDVGVTLDKISKIYGITRERVRQILI